MIRNGKRRLKGEDKDKRRAAVRFDLEVAKRVVDDFSYSCGVRCCLYDAEGEPLYEHGPLNGDCAFCRKLAEQTGSSFKCERLHSYAAFQAERFGGRYIYSCPTEMAFFTSPIMMGGTYAGALVGGPALIVDTEDFLEGDAIQTDRLTPAQLSGIKLLLLCVPQVEPCRLEHLSGQLFADAVYISDSMHELFAAQKEDEQRSAIGNYMASLRSRGTTVAYPIDKEVELSKAIAQGDRAAAALLLNEILGHIFFRTSDPEEIRNRTAELLVVLSRAAIQGGANVEQIFEINQQYTREMRWLDTPDELTRWLAGSLDRFADLVFDLMEVKHRNAMHSAVDYMKANYARRLTLEEVSAHTGYSAAYFSKIFRDEMGQTFKEYLNELRVEKSKTLLLTGKSTILEVCSMVGFNDQSYYCKVFQKVTGASPDAFRKRTRRIDTEKEYGLK